MAIEVKFIKDTSTNLQNTSLYPLVQGQLLFSTDTEDIYQDVANTSTGVISRISKGGNISTEDYSGGGTSYSISTYSSLAMDSGEEVYTNLELTLRIKTLEETVDTLLARVSELESGK